jgi:serine/threonine protein phosphatase PrpC
MQIFREEYAKHGGKVQQCFVSVCRRLDGELAKINSAETGSTCCLVFIRKAEGKRTCHVANLGDTRAVLCSEKHIGRRVTIDHKVSNPSE